MSATIANNDIFDVLLFYDTNLNKANVNGKFYLVISYSFQSLN